MEVIKWYKQSEDDIYNNPVDWSTSYYHIRMKNGTEHLLAVWLDESGDGSRHEHYEFVGEDEPVDLDEIELWRPINNNVPANNNTYNSQCSDDINKAAQEYSFMIPTQYEVDSLWKQETEQHFKDGAIWGKEKMIKKVCKWLKDNAVNYMKTYHDAFGEDFKYNLGELIEDFKKDMEEELKTQKGK